MGIKLPITPQLSGSIAGWSHRPWSMSCSACTVSPPRAVWAFRISVIRQIHWIRDKVTKCVNSGAEEGLRVHTMGLLGDPGLSGLSGVGTVRVGGGGHCHLVLIVPLNVAFTQEEQTAWFEAPDKFSESLGEA